MDAAERLAKWDGYFRSSVCDVKPNEIRIRGYALQDLMGNFSYPEIVALTLKGELPSEGEAKVTDAILSSVISHGFIDSSEAIARFVAAGNPNPIAACAAGLLGIGFYQAGATRYVAEFINEAFAKLESNGENLADVAKEVAAECVAQKRRIPGFGHPIHTADPRAIRLFQLAEKYNVIGLKTKLYKAIHSEFMSLRGKEIVINADGAAGALLADFGYDPLHMEVLVGISFLPGILASTLEEMKDGVPFRILPDVIAKYTGVAPREIPTDRKKE
ncbi:citryl-CoA lyase [Paradesulfitobacterium aromaticivorans]